MPMTSSTFLPNAFSPALFIQITVCAESCRMMMSSMASSIMFMMVSVYISDCSMFYP